MTGPRQGIAPVTRRRFLRWSGVAAAGALAAGGTAIGLADLLGGDHEPVADTPVLVLVTLYGGNDGLSTVVPAGDAAYHDGRRELAYRPEDVLALGEGLGLNPAMPRLHGLWGAGRLAIVRGVGYPKPDHSHFRSMAIWQTASPASPAPSGWLGRWLDATGDDDPRLALSLEPTLPPLLAGIRSAGSTIRPSGLVVPTGPLADAYRMLGAPAPTDPPAMATVASSVADLFTVAEAVNGALSTQFDGVGGLAAQLGAVAALVAGGAPTRVYSTSLGGFDTHADERGTQERLLGELDAALGAFVDQIAGTSRPVVTVVYSEFGRRVGANASQGTDHGTAGPVLVMGDNVVGGFHGAQPDIADLDAGDLRFTTDFRDVYATLLDSVLRTDPDRVLGRWPGRVPIVSST